MKKEVQTMFTEPTNTSLSVNTIYQQAELSVIYERIEKIESMLTNLPFELVKLLEHKSTVDANSELIDIHEASRLLNLSTSTLYKKTSNSTIPFMKAPGSNKVLFSREKLMSWVEDTSGGNSTKINLQVARRL